MKNAKVSTALIAKNHIFEYSRSFYNIHFDHISFRFGHGRAQLFECCSEYLRRSKVESQMDKSGLVKTLAQ